MLLVKSNLGYFVTESLFSVWFALPTDKEINANIFNLKEVLFKFFNLDYLKLWI